VISSLEGDWRTPESHFWSGSVSGWAVDGCELGDEPDSRPIPSTATGDGSISRDLAQSRPPCGRGWCAHGEKKYKSLC